MSTPPRTAVENFAILRRCLSQAVAAQTGWGLALPLISLIINRIRILGQRFSRLAARIGAGTFVPRRPPATPRKGAAGRPRPPGKLPNEFAWLRTLMPEVAGFGAQLDYMFHDPEMAALLAAAPGPMARVLRPLCWMLGVTPPPILSRKRPAPARPQPAPPPAVPQAGPEPPAPQQPDPKNAPTSDAPSPPGRPRLRGPPAPRPA